MKNTHTQGLGIVVSKNMWINFCFGALTGAGVAGDGNRDGLDRTDTRHNMSQEAFQLSSLMRKSRKIT